MITASASERIFHAVGRVYEFIAVEFVTNYPRWSSEVVELQALSEGPVRIGFRARQVRIDRGHKSESIFEVSELEPSRCICFNGVSAPYRCRYEFDDLRGSTRLTFTFELLKVEPHMRPFEKLIRMELADGAKRTVRKLQVLLDKDMLARG